MHPAGQTVSCSLGTLNAGAAQQVEVRVTVLAAGMLQAQAGVSASTPDPWGGNNQATATTSALGGEGDLVASLQLETALPLMGMPFPVTVGATHGGSAMANSTTAVLTLPPYVSYLSGPLACSAAGNSVACVLGNVPPGGTGSRSVTLRAMGTGTGT